MAGSCTDAPSDNEDSNVRLSGGFTWFSSSFSFFFFDGVQAVILHVQLISLNLSPSLSSGSIDSRFYSAYDALLLMNRIIIEIDQFADFVGGQSCNVVFLLA